MVFFDNHPALWVPLQRRGSLTLVVTVKPKGYNFPMWE